MSHIHKFIEDKDLSKAVRNLFRDFVNEFDSQSSLQWEEHVTTKKDIYHRKRILSQGRCNFDKPPFNLSQEELRVLYNYYYFPMHFQSSYSIYSRFFEENLQIKPNDKTFFFHDYGCGTLSSTIAFSKAYIDKNQSKRRRINPIDWLNYVCNFQGEDYTVKKVHEFENTGGALGFSVSQNINGFWLQDISQSVIEYNVKKQHPTKRLDFFNCGIVYDEEFGNKIITDKFYFGNFELITPYQSFLNFSRKKNSEICIILNFSYVLASSSINIKKIIHLISLYLDTGSNLLVVNQNPNTNYLNLKWEEIKTEVKYKKSIKGIQPIKHFGNTSNSRYEILIF